MKTYLVGGAVRDTLMGLEPKDKDYVVVGATPAQMLERGFSQVGASFPVFLHPETGDEYALARTERKTGIGYNGFDVVFDPTITLEQDLIRRDLTINSMAMDLDTGTIIDPYGGRQDLIERTLRHTSDAFAEDPVRVLRTARFAARYGFNVADETKDLMRQVVREIDAVPAERVFAEFAKGLMEDYPLDMIQVLRDVGAADSLHVRPFIQGAHDPDFARLTRDHTLVTRFALLASSFKDGDYDACKIPVELSRVAKAVWKNRLELAIAGQGLDDGEFLTLCDTFRVFSDSQFVSQCLDVIDVLFPDHDRSLFNARVDSARIDAAAVAASVPTKEIKAAIRAARLAAMATTRG